RKLIKHLEDKMSLQIKDYVRIINRSHYNSLITHLSNGTIYYGCKTNRGQLIIEPTILENISWKDPIMKEEIFGPLLPVLPFRDLKEVRLTLQTKEKPLALYYIGKNKRTYEHLFKHL